MAYHEPKATIAVGERSSDVIDTLIERVDMQRERVLIITTTLNAQMDRIMGAAPSPALPRVVSEPLSVVARNLTLSLDQLGEAVNHLENTMLRSRV